MKAIVIGLGSMGKRRIRNLKALQIADIIAFDVSPERREEAAAKYGVTTVATLEEGMRHDPDLFIISTPPDGHMQFAHFAADHNKHFFTEASVVDDGMEDLLKKLVGKSIVAAPSCTLRFHPSIRKIKQLIDDNAIGKVLSFTYHSGQYLPDWHPWQDYRTFYVAKRVTGACREIVPFELAWLTHLFGGVQLVTCLKEKATQLDVDIDDVYQLLLRFADGTQGSLQVDVISRVPYRTMRILSEHGVIQWDWQSKIVRVFQAESKQWSEHAEFPGTIEPGYIVEEEMYIEEIRAVLGAIRGVAPYGYTYADDLRILRALYAAEQSSETGKHIWLDDCGGAK